MRLSPVKNDIHKRPYMGDGFAEKFHGIMQIPYAPDLYKKTGPKTKAQLLKEAMREDLNKVEDTNSYLNSPNNEAEEENERRMLDSES
jgi:hypothetical protein